MSLKYIPHQWVTIDEAMIPFKGCLSFKQYIKAKPTKWDIKVFILGDATSGYIHRMLMYTGKIFADDSVGIGLCSRMVLELIKGLEDDGHCVFTDNYYTSPQLALTLYNKGINSCGTVRTTRSGYPKDLVKKKAYQGYSDYR